VSTRRARALTQRTDRHAGRFAVPSSTGVTASDPPRCHDLLVAGAGVPETSGLSRKRTV